MVIGKAIPFVVIIRLKGFEALNFQIEYTFGKALNELPNCINSNFNFNMRSLPRTILSFAHFESDFGFTVLGLESKRIIFYMR